MYQFEIWQLNDTPEVQERLFLSLSELKKDPDKTDYHKVYEEKDLSGEAPRLEDLFVRFQRTDDNPLADFPGHSMSISDIITIKLQPDMEPVVFYVDRFGFGLVNWDHDKLPTYTDSRLFLEAYTAAVVLGLIDDWVKIEDYHLPSGRPTELTDMEFNPVCYPNYGGSEGIYLDCSISGVFDQTGEKKELHIGTLKTLDESMDAMITGGAACGALTAMIRRVVNANYDAFLPENHREGKTV